MRRLQKILQVAVVAAIAWQCVPAQDASAQENGWQGKRRISWQHSKDLFYNQYVGPGPGGRAAQMNVSPLPVPENVGHTWGTYQPFYPHEYLYRHTRSYHNYHPGAGWTRTNVRYRTGCNTGFWDDVCCGAKNCFDFGSLLDCCTP